MNADEFGEPPASAQDPGPAPAFSEQEIQVNNESSDESQSGTDDSVPGDREQSAAASSEEKDDPPVGPESPNPFGESKGEADFRGTEAEDADDEFPSGGMVDDGRFFAPIALSTLVKLHSVYTHPLGLKRLLKAPDGLADRPLWVVCGPENSGKLSCAIQIGLLHRRQQWRKGSFRVYRRIGQEVASLLEAVENDGWPKDCVIILEDAFEKGVSLQEIEPENYAQISVVLEEKGCLLILTSELPSARLRRSEVPVVDVATVALVEVLTKHLEYYFGKIAGKAARDRVESIKKEWQELKVYLQLPCAIDSFCSEVKAAGGEGENLLKIAARVQRTWQGQLDTWFLGLSSNEKLVALLAYLFSDIDRVILLQLYRDAAESLIGQGMLWLEDPRSSGIRTAFASVRLSSDDDGFSFETKAIERELATQCESWQWLLWSVVMPWIDLVAERGPGESISPRSALGSALGRLGVHDSNALTNALKKLALARGRFHGVAANQLGSLPGYALAEIIRSHGVPKRGLVLGILRRLFDSGSADQHWALASALWRVHAEAMRQRASAEEPSDWDAFEAELFSVLLDLARHVADPGRAGGDLRLSVAIAFERAGSASRSMASRVLVNWLQNSQSSGRSGKNLLRLGSFACELSFKKLGEYRRPPIFRDHHAILTLVRPVLSASGSQSKATTASMSALRGLLRWPDWRAAIVVDLLAIANFGDSTTRRNLQAALSRCWLTSSDADAVSLAHALIGRCQAMEGIVIDRPDFGSAVLVVDPDFFLKPLPKDATEKQRGERDQCVNNRRGAAWQLAGLLGSQLDLTIARLGECSSMPVRSGLVAPRLESPSPAHRLMMPALMSVEKKGLRLLVVLTGEPIADLEDALVRGWLSDVLVIAANTDFPDCGGAQILRVEKDLDAGDLRKVQTALEARWAQALATAPPQAWWGLLRRYDYPLTDAASLEQQLEFEAEKLTEMDTAENRVDKARAALAAILLLAATELEVAIKLLRRWLKAEDPSNAGASVRAAMAAAGARALLRIHSSTSPVPRRRTVKRLFRGLAGPLSRWHSDGVAAVLAAIERWLEDPLLAKFFGGGMVNGRSRLVRWAEEHAQERASEFDATLARLLKVQRRFAEDSDWAVSGLTGSLGQLKYATVVGKPLEMPSLGEGERYGIIVVDVEQVESPWSGLGISLAETLLRKQPVGLKPVVFRLGETAPAWVPDEEQHGWVKVDSGFTAYPRVLGAFLNPQLTPDKVAFVLVLSQVELLDEEDWIGSVLYDRLYSYKFRNGRGRSRPWLEVPGFGGKQEPRLITAYLADRTGFQMDRDAEREPLTDTPPDAESAVS